MKPNDMWKLKLGEVKFTYEDCEYILAVGYVDYLASSELYDSDEKGLYIRIWGNNGDFFFGRWLSYLVTDSRNLLDKEDFVEILKLHARRLEKLKVFA
jgi:hypothetical protein